MPQLPEWARWAIPVAYLVVLALMLFLNIRVIRNYNRRTLTVFEKLGQTTAVLHQELSSMRSYLMKTPEGKEYFTNRKAGPCKHCGEPGVMFSSEGPDIWYCGAHGLAIMREQAEDALRRRAQNKALHGP